MEVLTSSISPRNKAVEAAEPHLVAVRKQQQQQQPPPLAPVPVPVLARPLATWIGYVTTPSSNSCDR